MTNTAVREIADVEDNWVAWLRSVAGANATTRNISDTTHSDYSTVWRWLEGQSTPSASTVIAVARAYRADPIGALIAAGYLTRADLELPSIDPRQLPTHVLIAEITRRSE